MRDDETTYSFPEDSASCFHLQMTGISRCSGAYRIERRPKKNFYVFEYVQRGQGFLEIDKQHLEPSEGDVYLVDGSFAHSYWSSADRPWLKIWFNVEGPLIASLLEMHGVKGKYLFNDCQALEGIFIKGFETARDNPMRAQQTAALCIHELIQELSSRMPRQEKEPVSEFAVRMKDRIDANLSRSPSIKELCALCGMSPSQTLRIFKKAYGETPVQYSLSRRIATAKIMLEGTAKPVKEIAANLGFTDEYYFSNMFKARVGSAPTAYRKLSR